MIMQPTLSFPDAVQLNRGPEVVAETGAAALTVENLCAAYRRGIFPWPGRPGDPIPWCCPRRRAVLKFDELTPGRTLEKTARKPGWSYSIDRAFPQVIAACAAADRPGQDGTWISPAVVAAYTALHDAGWAKCGAMANWSAGSTASMRADFSVGRACFITSTMPQSSRSVFWPAT